MLVRSSQPKNAAFALVKKTVLSGLSIRDVYGLQHLTGACAESHCRHASSSSSTRWKTRQAGDHFAREARVQGLKSRAAFKLLQVFAIDIHT